MAATSGLVNHFGLVFDKEIIVRSLLVLVLTLVITSILKRSSAWSKLRSELCGTKRSVTIKDTDEAWLAHHVTVIVTTSVAESNPSTLCLETVFESFGMIHGLWNCAKVVVCDWPGDEQYFKRLGTEHGVI